MTGVIVSWQRDTYIGCYKTDGGSIIVNGILSNFTLTELEEDSRYAINVRPFNDAGNGSVSNTVNATTREEGRHCHPLKLVPFTLVF